ncbi:MAG TPA: CsgG/HfaB family protein [Gemmatimonadales bacterium]|jgi:curli biogenesis system outer membrane secretion channel CsgG|nr:CsgG/HfaB family protein [Gemmatimonadales bacterium]
MRRSVRLAAVLALAFPAVVRAQRPVPLVLPPGWNDSWFEKLDQGQQPRTVVAVMNFAGAEVLEQRLQIQISDALVTSMVQAGRFDVVERQRLDLVMNEQNLHQRGLVDPATAARVGKILGAQLVVYGVLTGATEQKIDKFSYDLIRIEVSMDVRAVDVSTGKVAISETAKGTAEARIITSADGTILSGPTNYDPLYHEASRQALDRAAALVSGAVPLVGFVVATENRTVTLDLGESRGVKTGDTFIVFRRGEPLLHPVSHAQIGWNKTVLAAIQVTDTENDLSHGRILNIASGAELKPGDLVILRPSS